MKILLFLIFSSYANADTCVLGSYAVSDRNLMACQRNVQGVAVYDANINNSRLAMFLEEYAEHPQVKDSFYRAVGKLPIEAVKILDSRTLKGLRTTPVMVPENSPEREKALKEFVDHYNQLQGFTGLMKKFSERASVGTSSLPATSSRPDSGSKVAN